MNRPAVVIPLVLLVCVLGAIGQTLLKLSVTRITGEGPVSAVVSLARDPAFWGGGVVVAAGTITWLYVMSRAHLTYAMPFLGIGFVLTMITSAVILHEPQPTIRIVGTFVIAIGMALVAWGR